jgi:hypothetical protein
MLALNRCQALSPKHTPIAFLHWDVSTVFSSVQASPNSPNEKRNVTCIIVRASCRAMTIPTTAFMFPVPEFSTMVGMQTAALHWPITHTVMVAVIAAATYVVHVHIERSTICRAARVIFMAVVLSTTIFAFPELVATEALNVQWKRHNKERLVS